MDGAIIDCNSCDILGLMRLLAPYPIDQNFLCGEWRGLNVCVAKTDKTNPFAVICHSIEIDS